MTKEPRKAAPRKAEKKQKQKVETTGHSWDGIEEYNNPLPRWWLWTFYATIIWGVGYMIAYPAWPLLERATPGILGFSTRSDVAEEIRRFDEMNAPLERKLVEASFEEVLADEELKSFATHAGSAVFQTWCIQCHGSGGQGAKGYPNLLDDDWLWGGDLESIHTTIMHGVRSEADEETHTGDMPAWADVLEPEEIDSVVEYVLQISGQEADTGLAEAGKVVFEDNCTACHGDDGSGDRDLGAPNLTDAIWLYGGDREAVKESVLKGRKGVMPNWNARLSEADIKAVALYVHQLGGGE